MNQIFIFILGVVFGGAVTGFWFFRKYKEVEGELRRIQNELEKEKEILGGFDEYNRKIARLKEDRKQKILDVIKEKSSIRSGDVGDLLGVSRATAFRYLEELEKTSKIEQVGAFGKEVKYKIKI